MSDLKRDIAWYQEGERDHDFLCHLADGCIARIIELEAEDERLRVALRLHGEDTTEEYDTIYERRDKEKSARIIELEAEVDK